MDQRVPEAADADRGFVLRSARYLVRHGLYADQLRDALCTELGLSEGEASDVAEMATA